MRFPPVPRQGRALLTALGGALVGALLSLVGLWYFYGPKPSTTSPNLPVTTVEARDEILVLGRIEPRGGLIPVFGTPGDHIVEFLNKADKVGTAVSQGTQLVKMAGDELREKETALAQQQLDDATLQKNKIEEVSLARKKEAEQEIKNTERTREAELNAQRAKIEVARLQVQLAETQLQQVQSLSAGTVARADISKQELQVRQAQADLKAAEDLLRSAEQAFVDGKELAKIKLQAAEAEMQRAVAAVPLKTAKLGYEAARLKEKIGQIRAPVSGTVVRVQTVPGETTTQVKPILQLAANTGELVVRVEIPERDVEPIRDALKKSGKSLTATVTSRSLGASINLQAELKSAEQIAQTITRNTVVELAPSTGSDRRVVEAVLDVTEKDPEKLKTLRDILGVQVEVSIHLQGKPNASARK